MKNSKFTTKGKIYKLMSPWLGDGLLLSSGHKWHQRRKIITPTFHFNILEQFVEVFDQQSQILVKSLNRYLNQGVFDIHPFITAAALDVIAETAMSSKLNAQSDPNSEYVRAVGDISEVIARRMVNVYYQFDIVMKLFEPSLWRCHQKARRILHDFTRQLIIQRRQSLIQQNEIPLQDKAEDNIGRKRRIAFLDLLLQSTIDGQSLTDAEIQEEVDTFMFEGHDTTTSGIAFALYNLSRHPDIQQKVFEEICEIFGNNKDQPIDLEKLQNLKYMELVIKESLRLYPPVPIIARATTEETLLHNHIIPSGADIIIPIFAISRNAELFPDPDRFWPERHALDNLEGRQISPFAYMPFSAGSRNCIGQKFAMLELKSIISKILRYYELLPIGEEPKVEMNLITRSTNGVHMAIKPRSY